MEMVKKCRLPVIFYHGETDDFVPCDMSRQLYEACASRKQLITVPGAGHGLSFPVDQEYYLKTLRDFFGPEASSLGATVSIGENRGLCSYYAENGGVLVGYEKM